MVCGIIKATAVNVCLNQLPVLSITVVLIHTRKPDRNYSAEGTRTNYCNVSATETLSYIIMLESDFAQPADSGAV